MLRDKEGKAYSVWYDPVNAMLRNGFLKEHRKVQTLGAAFTAMDTRFKEQEAKIARVNDKLDLSQPAQQIVVNTPNNRRQKPVW